MPAYIKWSLLLALFALLAGCTGASPTGSSVNNSSLSWNIEVLKAEVKTELKTKEVETLYNQEKNDLVHENVPAAGSSYLLLQLQINKTGTTPLAFDWKDLAVKDESGNVYPRLSNDSFIEQHGYTPRLTGLPIRFGDNQGWICFEISSSSANGKLSLVYTSSEGQADIGIKK